MGCSCQSGPKSGPVTYTVVVPGGKQKVYSSYEAAANEVQRVDGAYLANAPTGAI